MQFDLDALVSVNTFSQKSFSQKEGFKYIYLTKINKNDLNETSVFFSHLILIQRHRWLQCQISPQGGRLDFILCGKSWVTFLLISSVFEFRSGLQAVLCLEAGCDILSAFRTSDAGVEEKRVPICVSVASYEIITC